MRLDKVEVDGFKNLRGLKVDFNEHSPFTVLVGPNGAGKSNLLEALAIIFRDLDLDQETSFTYRLEYFCRGRHIKVSSSPGKSPELSARESEGEYVALSRRDFASVDLDGHPLYRPDFVFGYYSGPSERLGHVFDAHRERYYSWIIKSEEQRDGARIADPNVLRRLFFAQTLHGQFALLAFFMSNDKSGKRDLDFLREHLQIDGLDSVLFALKRPPWIRRGGDARFWNAMGEVKGFLGHLFDEAVLPLRMDRRINTDITKNPSIENLYLFLQDQAALERVYKRYGDQYTFFTALESTHLSKLLAEVRIRVRMTQGAGKAEITYRDLSEGEQQLLLVLGLLKFTARDEALFLLDEPDTHLNPAWSAQYLSFLKRFIPQPQSCHIVMTSHDPLLLAGLSRSEVRILSRNRHGAVVCTAPDMDPKGMGVAAILTSDVFGLRSTLDLDTQQQLDRQRTLATKQELTEDELNELAEIGASLARTGLTGKSRDPLYAEFTKAWAKRADPAWLGVVRLTPEALKARANLVETIVAELEGEERRGS